jgi:hypothetical protein
MGDKRIFEKLEKVNSEKEEIVFKMEYKGKVIHSKTIELPGYAKDIIDDEDLSFFYFFKDMANKLEEKIDEIHKKKIWNDLNNEKNGRSDKNAKS